MDLHGARGQNPAKHCEGESGFDGDNLLRAFEITVCVRRVLDSDAHRGVALDAQSGAQFWYKTWRGDIHCRRGEGKANKRDYL